MTVLWSRGTPNTRDYNGLTAIPFQPFRPTGDRKLISGDSDIWNPDEVYVGIYHVYSMYMYGGGIRRAFTTYIQWISKFQFHVFKRNSMLHINVMAEDNIMLKPEMYVKA